jgi:DinB superfamily
MDTFWRTIVWQQFGAAIDMLENAMLACPDELWSDRSQRPEFWYLVYHTLFFLDLYLADSVEAFVPPAPFTMDELDPAGLLPERPYTKEQLQTYLEHGRDKCRSTIDTLTDDRARQRCGFERVDVSVLELLLYNMRHVQHHAAQLNLILRQKIDSAPGWVVKTNSKHGAE